eukprot:351762-Prymnesium_polylepis.1
MTKVPAHGTRIHECALHAARALSLPRPRLSLKLDHTHALPRTPTPCPTCKPATRPVATSQ